jgi:hypothetical protein
MSLSDQAILDQFTIIPIPKTNDYDMIKKLLRDNLFQQNVLTNQQQQLFDFYKKLYSVSNTSDLYDIPSTAEYEIDKEDILETDYTDPNIIKGFSKIIDISDFVNEVSGIEQDDLESIGDLLYDVTIQLSMVCKQNEILTRLRKDIMNPDSYLANNFSIRT